MKVFGLILPRFIYKILNSYLNLTRIFNNISSLIILTRIYYSGERSLVFFICLFKRAQNLCIFIGLNRLLLKFFGKNNFFFLLMVVVLIGLSWFSCLFNVLNK